MARPELDMGHKSNPMQAVHDDVSCSCTRADITRAAPRGVKKSQDRRRPLVQAASHLFTVSAI